MTPPNHNSLKPQIPKETVLAAGEGDTECAFLTYLKGLYCPRGCGVSVRIENTFGGCPADMVNSAVKKKSAGDYDRSFLLLDTDVAWPGDSVNEAREKGVELIGSEPCVEGLLLWIIENNPAWATRSTDDCKKRFHQQYLSEDDKLIAAKYESVICISYDLI